MTQTALTPLALLHRPERITDTEMMASGIAQALDWMPVQPDAISGIWTAELDREQRTALLSLNQPFTQEALMYELDAFLGALRTGSAVAVRRCGNAGGNTITTPPTNAQRRSGRALFMGDRGVAIRSPQEAS
ncbi:Uncharacterised protein [Escherichia coli]|uniref:Uncharacterized protein n=1 Tax=Escherichia coli TaxID=562 RepID=A0A2X3LQF9_ECOLX|nr:Uncharacterised protein [Escherichia coli]